MARAYEREWVEWAWRRRSVERVERTQQNRRRLGSSVLLSWLNINKPDDHLVTPLCCVALASRWRGWSCLWSWASLEGRTQHMLCHNNAGSSPRSPSHTQPQTKVTKAHAVLPRAHAAGVVHPQTGPQRQALLRANVLYSPKRKHPKPSTHTHREEEDVMRAHRREAWRVWHTRAGGNRP
jgi:hypothetical protein